jgi:SAM-dependent methyltransferase
MHPISELLKAHYTETFRRHGATARGVDWGPEADVRLRYDKMLALIRDDPSPSGDRPAVLDVGCGFGGLYAHAEAAGRSLAYTGVDVADEMIAHAAEALPGATFVCADVLDYAPPAGQKFEYVVCSGILTQKLTASNMEMDRFAQQLVRRMFDLASRGVAFNVMTTKVNHFANNLYYRNPVELTAWCLSELTPHLRLDHAYPLYEYTMYLYRPPLRG